MKYAVLADIHGNSHALMAVLEDISKEYVDGYLCVGDYFGDFPYPNEVTDTIKSLKESHIISVNKEGYLVDLHASNRTEWVYDQFNALYWNYNELRDDNMDFLLNLPDKKLIEVEGERKVLLLHSITSIFEGTNLDLLTSSRYAKRMEEAPFTNKDYSEYIKNLLSDDIKLQEELEKIDADIIVFGHSHVQWHVAINDKLLINAGSCGLPLDYRSSAAYTILDIKEDSVFVEERRVQYDKCSLIEECKKSGLYEYAKYWCDITIDELTSARDDISFFFEHAWEIARKHQNEKWPLDNSIWEEAGKSWFEGR